MQILNVGIAEIIIVLILMFLLLGPKEMVRTAYRMGVWIRKAVRSPIWHEIMNYSQEIRDLPHKMMEESGLQETLDEVRQTTKDTAEELNTQISEAAKAARVPEMENLRLNPASVPAKTAKESVPQEVAEVPQEVAEAPQADAEAVAEADAAVDAPEIVETAETTGLEIGEVVTGEAETPAVLDVAETAGMVPPPVEKKPRRRKVVADAAAAVDGEVEPKPRRGRKPKQVEVVPQEVAVAPQEVAGGQETPRPRRGRKPKAAVEESADAGAVTDAAAVTDAGAIVVVEPKAPRKPRTRKVKESAESAQLEVVQQEAVPQEVAEVPQEVAEAPQEAAGARVYAAGVDDAPALSDTPDVGSQPVAARPRKPRAPRKPKNAAVETGNGAHPAGDPPQDNLPTEPAPDPAETPNTEEQSNPDAA